MTPTSVLNEFTFGQEGAAQLQTADLKENIIVQQPVAQIESQDWPPQLLAYTAHSLVFRPC